VNDRVPKLQMWQKVTSEVICH